MNENTYMQPTTTYATRSWIKMFSSTRLRLDDEVPMVLMRLSTKSEARLSTLLSATRIGDKDQYAGET